MFLILGFQSVFSFNIHILPCFTLSTLSSMFSSLLLSQTVPKGSSGLFLYAFLCIIPLIRLFLQSLLNLFFFCLTSSSHSLSTSAELRNTYTSTFKDKDQAVLLFVTSSTLTDSLIYLKDTVS